MVIDFGGRLRELREAAALTQVQLAQRAELHPQAVVKLERGEREPAWSTVVALCSALGIDCNEFMKPTGRPPKPNPEPPKKPRGPAASRKKLKEK